MKTREGFKAMDALNRTYGVLLEMSYVNPQLELRAMQMKQARAAVIELVAAARAQLASPPPCDCGVQGCGVAGCREDQRTEATARLNEALAAFEIAQVPVEALGRAE